MDCANHNCGADISTSENSDSDEEEWEAYVGHWTCVHGIDGDDQCDACDRGETLHVEEIQ